MTQFRPSRVLPRTFPLDLIGLISPTLETAKCERIEHKEATLPTEE